MENQKIKELEEIIIKQRDIAEQAKANANFQVGVLNGYEQVLTILKKEPESDNN